MTSNFTTGIKAGNIFEMLAQACRWMRDLDIPREERVALKEKVMNSKSYEEACDAIRKYFPIE